MMLSFGVLGPDTDSLQSSISLRLNKWNQCTKVPKLSDNQQKPRIAVEPIRTGLNNTGTGRI